MIKQTLAGLALLAFSSIGVYAQPTAAQMLTNQVARLTKLLDLTAAQQASATTYFTAEQSTLATLRTSMKTAQTALEAAIKTNDTSAIGIESTQIGMLTGEEVLARATAAGLFYAILTPDQQSKYDTLGPMGMGGFGGPGGPGGGPGPHGAAGSH